MPLLLPPAHYFSHPTQNLVQTTPTGKGPQEPIITRVTNYKLFPKTDHKLWITNCTALRMHAFPCLLWLRSRDEFDYKKFWTLIFEIKSPPPLDDVIEFISFLRDDKDLAFCRNFNAISNCFDSLSKLTHSAYSSHMLRGIWTFSAIMSMYGLIIAPKTNALRIQNRLNTIVRRWKHRHWSNLAKTPLKIPSTCLNLRKMFTFFNPYVAMRFVIGTVMSSKSVRRDLSGSPILVNLFLFRIIKNLSLESRDFYGILKMHNFHWLQIPSQEYPRNFWQTAFFDKHKLAWIGCFLVFEHFSKNIFGAVYIKWSPYG